MVFRSPGHYQALHRAGIRVQLGTLTPSGGTVVAIYSGEDAQQRVSDGVIDFDAALRDRADPSRLAPEYDSSDHLHPSGADYRKMASIVDPKALRGAKCRPVAVAAAPRL